MAVKERITLTIDPAVLARIDTVAQARHESRSATVERILRNGVEEEQHLLETIGQGIEGRVLAYLLQSPKALQRIAQVIGAEITPDKLAAIEADGPGVVQAGSRYRSQSTTPTNKENP